MRHATNRQEGQMGCGGPPGKLGVFPKFGKGGACMVYRTTSILELLYWVVLLGSFENSKEKSPDPILNSRASV